MGVLLIVLCLSLASAPLRSLNRRLWGPPLGLRGVSAQDGEATFSIQPAQIDIQAGASFTAEVVAENVSKLGAFEFKMLFPPGIVEVQDVQIGDFLGSTGRSVSALGPSIDNQAGTVSFGAFTFGTADGPTGTGTVARFTFLALQGGSGALALTDIQATDTQARLMTTSTQDGSVTVEGEADTGTPTSAPTTAPPASPTLPPSPTTPTSTSDPTDTSVPGPSETPGSTATAGPAPSTPGPTATASPAPPTPVPTESRQPSATASGEPSRTPEPASPTRVPATAEQTSTPAVTGPPSATPGAAVSPTPSAGRTRIIVTQTKHTATVVVADTGTPAPSPAPERRRFGTTERAFLALTGLAFVAGVALLAWGYRLSASSL